MRPRAALSLHACSHGYLHPRRPSPPSPLRTHHVQSGCSLHPRSHSCSIVSRVTSNNLPLFPCETIDSPEPTFIRFRPGSYEYVGGFGRWGHNALLLCIQLGHGSKIQPTATDETTRPFQPSTGHTGQRPAFVILCICVCVHLYWEYDSVYS